MSELRYPNESREYRDARDSLLKDEQELVDKEKSCRRKAPKASSRRTVERGLRVRLGQRQEDRAEGEVFRAIRGQESLLIYSFMFGPGWDKPCPSCTSLVDGFDRTYYQVSQHAAFVAIAKAPADRSMRGPGDVDGRRLRWFQDRIRPTRRITNASKIPTTCNCP